MNCLLAGRASAYPSFPILGVLVNAIQIPEAVARMEEWIVIRDRCRYVAVTGMHGITEAQQDTTFKGVLNSADLVVPDGMPLVWIARFKGYKLKRRVYGPELMLSFFEQTRNKCYRHFFYGGAPGVAQKLVQRLHQQFPEMKLAGVYCPPFRPLTRE